MRMKRGNGSVLRIVEDVEGKRKRMIELRHNQRLSSSYADANPTPTTMTNQVRIKLAICQNGAIVARLESEMLLHPSSNLLASG